MALSAETAVKKLARQAENCICPNCGTYSKYGFNTVCIKYLTFVCNLCKTAHQAVSHRCKSLTMSSWDQGEVLKLKKNGNEVARNTWLAGAPQPGVGGRPKEGDAVNIFKRFVVTVYEEKKYIEKHENLKKGVQDGKFGGNHDDDADAVLLGSVPVTAAKTNAVSTYNVGNNVPTMDLLDLMVVDDGHAKSFGDFSSSKGGSLSTTAVSTTGTSTGSSSACSNISNTNTQSFHCLNDDFGDFADFSSSQSQIHCLKPTIDLFDAAPTNRGSDGYNNREEKTTCHQQGNNGNNSKEEEDWGDFADFSQVPCKDLTAQSNTRDVFGVQQPCNAPGPQEDFADFANFTHFKNNNNNSNNNVSDFNSTSGHALPDAHKTNAVTDSFDWLSNDKTSNIVGNNQNAVSDTNASFDPFLGHSMQTQKNDSFSFTHVHGALPSMKQGYGNHMIMNNNNNSSYMTQNIMTSTPHVFQQQQQQHQQQSTQGPITFGIASSSNSQNLMNNGCNHGYQSTSNHHGLNIMQPINSNSAISGNFGMMQSSASVQASDSKDPFAGLTF